jgi:hypothetical protein
MMLLQNVTGTHGLELLRLTKPRHERLHPLRVTAFREPSRKAQWGKVLAVQFWLAQARDGDTALMLDADAMLHRALVPGDFPAEADLGLVLGRHAGWQWANSGVLLLRAGDRLRRFFAEVWARGPQPRRAGCPEGGEQGAINAALQAGPNLKIAFMPNAFNAYTFAPSPKPVISAFHGLPHENKAKGIAEILERKTES